MSDRPLPEVHFGIVEEKDADRELPEVEGSDLDDDDIEEIPADVIDILGFDPMEEEEAS